MNTELTSQLSERLFCQKTKFACYETPNIKIYFLTSPYTYGVINQTGGWAYVFDSASAGVMPAGTFESTITYTASIL